MAKKKKVKKRRNLTKEELIFKLKCNEIATKNIEKFMSGELSLEYLFSKIQGKKEA